MTQLPAWRFNRISLLVLFSLACWPALPAGAQSAAVNNELQLVVDSDGFNGSPVECLGLSNDGRWLAATADKVVRIWNLQSGQQLPALRGYQEPYGFKVGTVNALTYSPDSRYLLVGVTDNTEAGSTRIYELTQSAPIFRALLKGHLGCTRGIAFSPDGQHVATWGCDGQIIVSNWNAGAGNAEFAFHTRWDFVPDDDIPHGWVLDSYRQATKDNTAWELVPGGCFCFADNDHLIFSHCGSEKVVSVSSKRNLKFDEWPSSLQTLWQSGRSRGPLTIAGAKPAAGQSRGVAFADLAAFVSGSGPWIAQGVTTELADGATAYQVGVWNRNGTMLSHRHKYSPIAITFNVRAKLGASSDGLGIVHVWRLNDGGLYLPSFEPNAARLWNVGWNDAGLMFGDQFYPPAEFAANHRGPNNRLLDLSKMAIVPLRIPEEPVVKPSGQLANGTPIWLDRDKNLELVIASRFGSSPAMKSNRSAASSDSRTPLTLLNPDAADGDGSEIQVAPYFDNIPGRPWSYRFVKYPGVADGPHLLIGTESGTLVETVVKSGRGGALEMRIVRRYLGHTGGITSISISPDQQRFATSSLDGTLRIWPLKPPKVLADIGALTDGSRVTYSEDLSVRDGDVLQKFGDYTYFERIKPMLQGAFKVGQPLKLQISRKTRELATGERLLPTIRLQAAPDLAEPLLSLFVASDGEWVMWNDQGFYNASASGARHLGFHRNSQRFLPAEFYSSDKFPEYYQPKLVLENFRSKDAPTPIDAPIALASLRRELIEKQDQLPSVLKKETFAEIEPPKVKITNAAVNNVNVHVEVQVDFPEARHLDDVEVRFNQQTVPAQLLPNSQHSTAAVTTAKYTVDSPFPAGKYSIVASARHDRASSSDSTPVTIDVAGNSARATDLPNLYVLSIGISGYRDAGLKIESADRDAELVAAKLDGLRGPRFGAVEKRIVRNEQATLAELRESLAWLKKSAKSRTDLAIVFINAQALLGDDDEWFIAPADFDQGRLASTALPLHELVESVAKLPRVLIWGDLFHKESPVVGSGKNPFQADFKTRGVLLACAPFRTSIAPTAGRPGRFATAVAESLNTTGGKDLTFDTFCLRIKEKVRATTHSDQVPITVCNDRTCNGYVIGRTDE